VRERGEELVLDAHGFLGDAARGLGRFDLTPHLAFGRDALADVFDNGDRAHDGAVDVERRNPDRLRAFRLPGARRHEVAMKTVREDPRLPRERGTEMCVESARANLRHRVDERTANRIGRGDPAVFFEMPVPRPDHEGAVGGQDSLDGQVVEPPQHGGGQKVGTVHGGGLAHPRASRWFHASTARISRSRDDRLSTMTR
jgi:hypothetical protein